MDHQLASEQPAADTKPLKSSHQQPDVADWSQHLRDRRREKPLLSCNFCRSRKVKCDRQLPCKTCTGRGIGFACTYMPNGPRKNKVSVGDRIQQLETLVRSLAQQQQSPQSAAVHLDDLATGSSSYSVQRNPASTQSVYVAPDGATSLVSSDEGISVPTQRQPSLSRIRDSSVSPAPSEHGSMRLHPHGANYVGSVHWSAVLDSISELRDHYEEEEEARLSATDSYILHHNPGPRLLYEPVQSTKADLLASIPARRVVDRMIARYFNAQGIVPEILHRGHFLREYEKFWQDQSAASLAWIGLLFSIMCLSALYQQSIEDPPDAEIPVRAHFLREQTIHCLVLCQYTRGGEYVLETLINYLVGEMLLSKDAEIGLWLAHGMLMQLALSLGYHRDPQNFSNISPFVGEMRRRVWTVIVQMDLRLSSQMALPRLLKLQQCDTAEPRNLLDTDFDEDTVELPPSRPETEVTPVLYSLARKRIDNLNGLVSDLVNDTHKHPYTEIMDLGRQLQEAEASLPPIFRWQPLSQSFMVQPQIIMHRVWLQLAIHRLTIWLHRKYLTPFYTQAHYRYSRSACVQAAIKILEFQQMVDEETRQDGLLYPVRWMFLSSRTQAVFLLGMSILCYYIQLTKSHPEVSLDYDTNTRVHDLLRNTYPLWLQLSTVSRDAQQAVDHLSLLLGLRGYQGDIPNAASSPNATPQDGALSFDLFNWDTYDGCIANFPAMAAFSTNHMETDVPNSSSGVTDSFSDLLLANNAGLDG